MTKCFFFLLYLYRNRREEEFVVRQVTSVELHLINKLLFAIFSPLS